MPRIFWEERPGLNLGLDLLDTFVFPTMAFIVADVISTFDPSFKLDSEKHIEIDRLIRDPLARTQAQVVITIRALKKPARLENTAAIGDALWVRLAQMFEGMSLSFSLAICWEEDYYRDE